MEIGKSYYIETPTKFWSGKVIDIMGGVLVLANAAWIADTGRWSDFTKTGKPNEVEPIGGDGVWNLAVAFISGFMEYPGKLPTEQK